MRDAVPQHAGGHADAVGRVGLAAVAHPGLLAALRRRSPLELGIAQATFAGLLALAALFLERWGVAEAFVLGAAGAVLLVSALLLVLWTDQDDGAKPLHSIAAFPATADRPELQTFRSGVPAQSNTV